VTSTSDALPAPTPIRATSSTAIRKNPTTIAPKRANILGAKKTKLGAKKVTGEEIDFEAAERAAKAEAERIEKLGYDPEAEKSSTPTTTTTINKEKAIAAPTPISPPKGDYGSRSTSGHQRSPSEIERLGMGMGRLGFGQMAAKPATTSNSSAPRSMGFGSVGPAKSAAQGTLFTVSPIPSLLPSSSLISTPTTPIPSMKSTNHLIQTTEDNSEQYARQKFGNQKGIGSDEFFGKGAFDPSAAAEAKNRLQGFEGAQSISSNAYFGRPEEDIPGEEYGDLESAAKDFVRKFGITAGDDLENLISVAGEGGRRLRGAVARYLNS
jgi:ADP-ribosylation factor GTPase-activating protein 2/3